MAKEAKLPKLPKLENMANQAKDYPEALVLQAIKGSAGILSTVARKLECDWHTAEFYKNKWESTKKAYQDERETLLDMAESAIATGIRDGDLGSARWMLATLGKNRGYTEKTEVELIRAKPIDITKLTHEQKEAFIIANSALAIDD